jgi:hypothetical protein
MRYFIELSPQPMGKNNVFLCVFSACVPHALIVVKAKWLRFG